MFSLFCVIYRTMSLTCVAFLVVLTTECCHSCVLFCLLSAMVSI